MLATHSTSSLPAFRPFVNRLSSIRHPQNTITITPAGSQITHYCCERQCRHTYYASPAHIEATTPRPLSWANADKVDDNYPIPLPNTVNRAN